MLIAPGGGSGTPWESMSVEQMQVLIQNPDTDKHYDLLDGWKKSAELVSSHRFQVQSYRDNLAAVWPPEKSKAAEAYLSRLKTLIDNLTETYEAALANHDALAAATLSISLAQHDMKKIHDEYVGNQQLLLDFQTTQQQKQSAGTPTPTPSPSPSGEQPPVAPGRQEELKRQAVTLLSGVSSELAQAQVRLVRPKLYEAGNSRDDAKTINDPGYVAPPIPPITSGFVDNGTPSASASRPKTVFPTSGGNSSAGSPPIHTPPKMGDSLPGLVLGGTTSPVVTPPGLSPTPPPIPGGTPGPITSPGFVPSIANTFVPGRSTPPTPLGTPAVGRQIGLPREGLLQPNSSAGGVARVMPPGGIIGGGPATGVGQPNSARPGARRINPVGGMIGGGEPLGARPGTQGLSAANNVNGLSAYGQNGARRSAQRDQDNGLHWDADNPWQTAEGVDPVVLPTQENRVDPGPAIGLS